MAFESLSDRLTKAFKNITGKGKLTEKNMNDMLREVRMSLLEADVNYGVVKDFIARIKEKALGEEVLGSLNPGQMPLPSALWIHTVPPSYCPKSVQPHWRHPS